jgi:cytochrome c-type biogenesis protein CcmH/NrfG
VLTIVVCAVVGLGHFALAHARRRGIGPRLEVSRQVTLAAVAIVGAIVLVGGVAAGAPGEISDRIDEFTEPVAPDPTAGASRYESLSGNGRYQLWTSAVDANSTEPLVGIGPGTFEYWWAEDRPMDAYARSAHSLYLNSLAEVGIVGMLLIIAFVLVPIGVGLRRWFRRPASRELLAGAIAGAVTFAAAVGFDRLWELAVLPAVFLLLAAALLTPRDDAVEDEPGVAGAEPLAIPARVGLALVAIAATIAIAVPAAALVSVRESQAEVRNGDLDAALDAAREAGDMQPYAATPDYQEAQVLELDGNLEGAAAAAREATRNEPTNWRTWLVLARIEAEAGNVDEAIEAFERAEALNPRSDFTN